MGLYGSDQETCFERIALAVFASASAPQSSPSMVSLPLLHVHQAWRAVAGLLRRHQ
jgi:hypothetical protein